MTPDTSDDMATRSTGKKTFRPPVDDYFRRHVRDDHAPNAALHSTLRALAESDASRVTNVNLMASHGPGEKDHAATCEVVVDIENGGAGTAATGGTIVSKLVDYGDVVITDAESSSIVPESDAYDGDGDYPVDRLTVRLRPVETRVEPVEVPTRFIPDEYTAIDTLRRDAATTLRTAIDDHGVNDTTRIAAKALATVLCVNAPDSDYDDVEPDAAPSTEYYDLLERADVDFEDADDHGYADEDFAALVDELEDLASELEKQGSNRGEDLGAPYRRAASDIRVALDNHAPNPFPDATPGFVDADPHDLVVVACGCGDYSVKVPSTPEAIDVVCPECDNHFGHGEAPGEACPCRHDHDDAIDPNPEAIEAALPDGWSVAATDVFESFDMRRYTIDVYNRAYGRHRDDADDVDRSGTAADGIASGLGLAATAEAIARRDDGDGVDRGDVDLPDEVIGKALYKGTLAYNDEGRLVDNRDAMREGVDE